MSQLDWEIRDLAPLDVAPSLAGPAKHLLSAWWQTVHRFLFCLLARALDTPFDKSLQMIALAAELVHTATLLHDDVLDGARTRRGRLAAHLKYSAHTTILSGDALLTKGHVRCGPLKDPEVL